MSHYWQFTFLLCLSLLSSCDHQKDVKIEKVGNVDLAYYTRGHGEPLIMIMGFRGTMAIWDPALLDALDKKYTLILFDNRGVGLSTDTTEDQTTIAQMADDTAHLIQSLGYPKVHVLGWSMGSRIAMELALKYPEMVNTLILCAPNPGGDHQAPRQGDAFAKLKSEHFNPEEALSVLFPDTPEGNAAAKSYVSRLREGIAIGEIPNDIDVAPETVKRQAHALALWDQNQEVYDQLSKIKVPTLVTGGQEDVLDSPRNIELVACRIPFAWMAYFPDAGHNFTSQNFLQFSELVHLFITLHGKN